MRAGAGADRQPGDLPVFGDDDYELGREIGRSGSGRMVEATDRRDDRRVQYDARRTAVLSPSVVDEITIIASR